MRDIELTEEEAAYLDRLIEAPSTLAPEYAPQAVPTGDRSILFGRAR
jgi:hypothetical protein